MSGYKPVGRHREKVLTAAAVRNLGPGFHGDGGNLYLKVDPSGARRWIVRLTVNGKRTDIGLGSPPVITLSEARERALQHRKTARAGDDPLAAKRRSKGIPSFKEAAVEVYAHNEGGWRNDKHKKQWLSSLETYAFPLLGSKRIDKIDSADITLSLDQVWLSRPETARRVKQRIGMVLKWAIARGYRTDNPADVVQQALAKHDRSKIKRMKALPFGEVANAITTVKESKASAATKLAFELLVHTACRSGEVRNAEWGEVNFASRTWTIPASRMKMKKEHRVPLTDATLALLTSALKLRQEGTDLIFPNPKGAALSDMTLSKLMKELGIGAVPHGFRSSFRDWAGETTNHPHAVIEQALAHSIQNKAEAAYARSDLLEQRRDLMSEWSDFIVTPAQG
jgi:integrase